MGLAPQVMAWGNRFPHQNMGPMGLQAGIPNNTFPSQQLKIYVSILINNQWQDISNYVLYSSKVAIKRGKPDESSDVVSSQLNIRLKNPDKRFSPRNVSGPYYGFLGRNVKIKVVINPGSNNYTRFTGRVTEWPQEIITGQARFVSIVATGVIHRLTQGEGQAYSAMRRAAMLGNVLGQLPIAYWPLEGGAVNDTMFDLINNAPTELVDQSAAGAGSAGAPQFGSAYLSPGSDQVANIAGSWTLGMRTIMSKITPTDETAWCWGVNFGKEVRSGGYIVVGVRYDPTTQPRHLTLAVYANDDGTGRVDLYEANQAFTPLVGALTLFTYNISHQYNGVARFFELDINQGTGNDVDINLWIDGAIVGSTTYTATFANAITNYAPYRMGVTTVATDVSTTVGAGHFLILDNFFFEPTSLSNALKGYLGETPIARFQRICAEENIDCVIDELISTNDTMDAQEIKSPWEIIKQCAQVTEGQLGEDFDDNLRLGSRTIRYDQAAMLVLDYNVHTFDPDSFVPTDDDLHLRNDWTTTRPTGAFPQQYQKTSGTLNISTPEQDPINGAGRYDDSGEVSTETDNYLRAHAAFRVAQGTIDKIRFRSLPIWLEVDSGLINAWLSRDPLSGRVLMLNPPSDLGADTLDQVIDAYQEIFDQVTYHISANTVPNDIYKTGHLNVSGFMDSRGTTTNEDLDTTETGVDVAITTNAVWVHRSGDYNIIIDGEVMTVTAVGVVTGGPYPATQFQTLTVIRSINGVVKAHNTGMAVHVYNPFVLVL